MNRFGCSGPQTLQETRLLELQFLQLDLHIADLHPEIKTFKCVNDFSRVETKFCPTF